MWPDPPLWKTIKNSKYGLLNLWFKCKYQISGTLNTSPPPHHWSDFLENLTEGTTYADTATGTTVTAPAASTSGNLQRCHSVNILNYNCKNTFSSNDFGVCGTPMYSTRLVSIQLKFEHRESQIIAINLNITSWHCDIAWRWVNLCRDVVTSQRDGWL